MPETVLGIPSHYVFYGMAIWMLWASFFGAHNRILARIALAGLLAFLAVPFYILQQEGQLADYPTLATLGLVGFMTFLVASTGWCLLDGTPLYRKLFRRNNP